MLHIPAPRRPGVSRQRHRTHAAFGAEAFRYYAVAQTLATTGTWMHSIALNWLALTLTHSAVVVGMTTMLQFIPGLVFGAYGGAVVDRFSRASLVRLSQAANAAITALTGVLVLTGGMTLTRLYVIAAVSGLIWVVDTPARQVLLTDVMPPALVGSGVSLMAAAQQLARFAGPALAGFMISRVGQGAMFLADAALFCVGLLFWRRIRVPVAIRPTAAPGAPAAGLGEVIRHLRGRPRIAMAIGLVGIVGAFGLNFPLVLSVIAQEQHGGAALYGTFNTMLAVGSIAGVLLIAGREPSRLRQIVALCGLLGLIQVLAAYTDTRTPFLIVLASLGMASVAFQAWAQAAVQLWAAPHLRGRVMGIYGQVLAGGATAGAPIIAAVTQHFGGQAGLMVCGLVPLIAAVVLFVLVYGAQTEFVAEVRVLRATRTQAATQTRWRGTDARVDTSVAALSFPGYAGVR